MTVRRARADDVARLAGVSTKTVSRVFTDRGSVAPETVERVLDAAARLRFRPSSAARVLRSGGASSTIGLVIGELDNPFFSAVASGIERRLAAADMTLAIATTGGTSDGERQAADGLLAQRVRALLLVPAAPSQAQLDDERRLGTPIVAIDRPARDVVADAVVLENRQGAREATEWLISHGHRSIGYVCTPASIQTQEERIAGYRDALEAARLPTDDSLVHRSDSLSPDDLAHAALTSNPAPTAIVAGNNRVCLAVLRAARGSANPPALVSFDDFEAADLLGVTAVRHDPREMGRRAADLALDRLARPDRPARTVRLPTRLIPRGSGERPPHVGSSSHDARRARDPQSR